MQNQSSTSRDVIKFPIRQAFENTRKDDRDEFHLLLQDLEEYKNIWNIFFYNIIWLTYKLFTILIFSSLVFQRIFAFIGVFHDILSGIFTIPRPINQPFYNWLWHLHYLSRLINQSFYNWLWHLHCPPSNSKVDRFEDYHGNTWLPCIKYLMQGRHEPTWSAKG